MQHSGKSQPAWTARAVPLVCAALAAALFGYVALRAARLSFTYDESVSYLYVARLPVADILHDRVVSPSGNHVVTSLSMKLARRLAGSGELAPRSGSLGAAALFLVCVLVLARRLAGAAGVAFLALAAANPFLLDFFSLARGYGPALALETLALAFLAARLDRSSRLLSIATAVAAAAVPFAHLAFLHTALALLAVLIAVELVDGRSGGNARRLGAAVPAAVMTIAMLAWAVPRALALRAANELYFGGEHFWRDTVASLADATLYGAPYGTSIRGSLAIVLAAAMLLVAAGLMAVLRSGDSLHRNQLFMWLAVFLLAAAAAPLQRALFGTKLLFERTALQLVPLAALLLGASLAALESANARALRWGSRAVAGGLAALLLVHLGAVANVRSTYTWRYDADTRTAALELASIADRRGGPVLVNANRLLEPTLAFYRVTRGLDRVAVRPGFDGPSEYALTTSAAEGPPSGGFRRVRTYAASGATLWRTDVPQARLRTRGEMLAWLDHPSENARLTSKTPFLLSGWSAEIAGPPPSLVEVTIDGTPVAIESLRRTPRPDLTSAVPELADPLWCGFEARVVLPAGAGAPGPAALRLRFRGSGGNEIVATRTVVRR